MSTTDTIYQKRIKALQYKLGNENLDALLIRSAANIEYLTGYARGDAYAIVGSTGQGALLVTHQRRGGAGDLPLDAHPARGRKFCQKRGRGRQEGRLRTSGFEAQHMYYQAVRTMRREIGRAARMLPQTRTVEKLRAVKQPRNSGRAGIDQGAGKRAQAFCRDEESGEKRTPLLNEFEEYLRTTGAGQTSFDTIVGRRGQRPPRTRRPEPRPPARDRAAHRRGSAPEPVLFGLDTYLYFT